LRIAYVSERPDYWSTYNNSTYIDTFVECILLAIQLNCMHQTDYIYSNVLTYVSMGT